MTTSRTLISSHHNAPVSRLRIKTNEWEWFIWRRLWNKVTNNVTGYHEQRFNWVTDNFFSKTVLGFSARSEFLSSSHKVLAKICQ